MDGPPRTEEDHADSVRQQEVVADLGRRALETDDPDPLLSDAAAAVVDASRADYGVILELPPGGDEGRLRAWSGWRDGTIGTTTVPTPRDSHLGSAVHATEPIVADDLTADDGFTRPELFESLDVASGVSVAIGPVDEPWGVLGAYASKTGSFSAHDVNFLRGVANALGSALVSGRARHHLEDDRPLTERIVGTVGDGVYALDDRNRFVLVNDAFCELTGYDREELLGAHASLVHSDDVDERATELAAATTGDEEAVLEVELRTSDGETIPVESRFVPYEYREGRYGRTGIVRDITERRRFEETLTALYEPSRQLFRAASEDEVATLVVEAGTDVLDFTDVALYLRDDERGDLYPAEKATEAGFMWDELPRIQPDDSTIAGHAYASGESVLEDDIRESPFFIEEETDMRAGLYVPVGEYGVVFAGSTTIGAFDEQSRRLLELLAETTEAAFDRLERERRLVESERRYRTLAEHFPNGAVGVYDRDLRYTLAAGAAVGDTLPSADQVEGKRIRDVYPDDVVADLEPLLRAAIEDGETGRIETEAMGRHWQVWATPLRDADGDVFAGLSFAQDVTERKERERELEQYETILETVPDGAYILDEAHRYRFVNEAFVRIAGYSREELLGSHLSIVAGEEVIEKSTELREEMMAGERDFAKLDSELDLASGETIPIETRFTLLPYDDEFRGTAGVFRDVSDRIEREEKLEELIDRLEASNERLEQFAYAASHDLQEPLRMVSSYLQLLEERYADALDEDGEEFLEFALDGADRMREMIERLLEYSRVETRGDPFEPVDLNDVLEDVLEDLQFRIEEHDAEITAEPLPTVEGDRGQLRQVLQNLLDNAIEYSGDGPPRVEVSAERDGPEWIVSVEDEGIGVDPADADRIFRVFQRLHTREEHPGTGIGLALCQRIVERHGGDIWVESDPGEGSTFWFTLPATSPSGT